MEDVTRVVLAMEAHDVAEEVMHFLDRTGHARVVGMAADDRQLLDAVRQLEPDAVIAQPSLVRSNLPRTFTGSLLAVETTESIAALRSAIRVGADGFFLWPTDRDALSTAANQAGARVAPPVRRAFVVAVHASSGGAGVTFVAAHIARAFAHAGLAVILIDGDPRTGDVGHAIGAPLDGVRSIADLVPLLDELTAGHLDGTLWAHPEGFRVLLAPPSAKAGAVASSDVGRVVEVAGTAADAVVVVVPHVIDGPVSAVLDLADQVLEVLTLDVRSFHAVRRAIDLCPSLEERVAFVVNRAGRAEVTSGDVERVFGRAPIAAIPFDRGVSRAQDHGRLRPMRGRSGRAFERLAARMMPNEPRIETARPVAGPGGSPEVPREGSARPSARRSRRRR
jgi:pilus assembly protein CpaE